MSKLQIDYIVHEPSRLGMMTMLVEQPRTFPEVKRALGLTQGNLAAHVRVLESAGYIEHQKEWHSHSVTTYILTAEGREALVDYVATAQSINAMLMAALTTTLHLSRSAGLNYKLD